MQRLVLVMISVVGLGVVVAIVLLTSQLLIASRMDPLTCSKRIESVAEVQHEVRRFLVERAGMPPGGTLVFNDLRCRIRLRDQTFMVDEVMATVRAGPTSVQMLSIINNQIEQRAARHRVEGEVERSSFTAEEVVIDLRDVAVYLAQRSTQPESIYDLTLGVDGHGLRWMISDLHGAQHLLPAGATSIVDERGQPATAGPRAPKEDWL